MLRVAAARSAPCLKQGARAALRRQWQLQRLQQLMVRNYADARVPDKTVLPGSQSSSVAGVPQPPILQTATTSPPKVAATDISPVQPAPPLPPTPAEVNANLPPTGTGSAKTGSSSAPPPPPKKRHRFRNFLLTLFLLSAFGYAGGVYYSLVNDNFHDFFTEYVPFGEDAVSYFEEREYRKRFPGKEEAGRYWPQTRGETKVTIGRQSGISPRVAAEGGKDARASSDLASKGRHLSAVEDNKAKPAEGNKAKPAEDNKAKPAEVKKEEPKSAQPEKIQDKSRVTHKLEPKRDEKPEPSEPKAAPAQPVATLVDNQSIAEGQETSVQQLVKMVNSIITAINASPEASKYQTVIESAKQDLNTVIDEIKVLRDQTAQEADTKIKNAHLEFDNAAKELVRRLEGEMREQETKWREEYEQEREKLSTSYQQKLSAELDAAKKVSEQKNQNALLEQEIALQKKFMDSVKAKVEEERSGRLSKLDELSSSVSELEKLTSQWNEVVDATLQTQHLQVALESVRAKLQESDHPTPFINELVALKEVSKDNDVVNAAIATINPVAYQRGIPSAAALIDRFRRVATEVRKASLLPEDAGVASHAASAVLSRLMFQKKSDRGLPEGDDVEATLARTEVLLEEGDLDAAAREMNNLRGWAGVLSRDWVSECRRVLEVKQAVDVIATEARLQSLLVD